MLKSTDTAVVVPLDGVIRGEVHRARYCELVRQPDWRISGLPLRRRRRLPSPGAARRRAPFRMAGARRDLPSSCSPTSAPDWAHHRNKTRSCNAHAVEALDFHGGLREEHDLLGLSGRQVRRPRGCGRADSRRDFRGVVLRAAVTTTLIGVACKGLRASGRVRRKVRCRSRGRFDGGGFAGKAAGQRARPPDSLRISGPRQDSP